MIIIGGFDVETVGAVEGVGFVVVVEDIVVDIVVVVVKTKGVVAVGICVVGVGTGHGYDRLSMVPFFPHTAVIQLPCPSVVL